MESIMDAEGLRLFMNGVGVGFVLATLLYGMLAYWYMRPRARPRD